MTSEWAVIRGATKAGRAGSACGSTTVNAAHAMKVPRDHLDRRERLYTVTVGELLRRKDAPIFLLVAANGQRRLTGHPFERDS